MELKQALAVSLIAVVCAALVLLMARALDLQAASRLEPQLAKMVEELQMVRSLLAQGSSAMPAGTILNRPRSSSASDSLAVSGGRDNSPGDADTSRESLIVWYFHGKVRCPTCRTIEAHAHEVVQTDFAQELASGRVVWKTADYEKPEFSGLAQKMGVRMPVVALVRMQGDQILESKTLEEVWGLVQEKPAFRDFLQKEIRQMLGRETAGTGSSGQSSEQSLATRPNLLRLEVPHPPGEENRGFSPPNQPEPKDLPVPE